MRTKKEILDSTTQNAKKAASPKDIELIHQLHILEVLIDIRDILQEEAETRMKFEKECLGESG